MPMPAPPDRDDASPAPPTSNTAARGAAAPVIPADSTPTWQAELLLSGGIVFALLQVPSQLDESFYWYQPRLDETWTQFAIFLYLYARVAVLAMVVSFIAHLSLRVLWVALVGLDSVYPHGINWEGTRYGPVSRRLAESDVMPLRAAASGVDNLSTLVFATGTLVASMSLIVLVFTLVVVALAQLLEKASGLDDNDYIVFGVLAITIVPPLLGWAIDRSIGGSLAPGSRGDRMVSALHRTQRLMSPIRELRQMLIVLTSNLGRRRGVVIVSGVFYVLIAATFIDLRSGLGDLHLDSYSHVARDDGARNIVAEHYRSQRAGRARYSLTPSIAAPVVDGDWLELFVPFRTVSHPRAISANCPGVNADPVAGSEDLHDATAVAAEAVRREAVLACIARLHPLAIDGQAVTDIHWDFHTEPVGELAGMLAMIDVRGLPPGRHELSIARLDTREPGEMASTSPPPPWRIVFWK
jgi:hypothetical protein